MKFLKIIAIGFVLIAVLIVIAVGGLGYGIAKTGEAIVDQANKPVVQKLENDNEQTTIIVPLKEKRGLKYEDISICTPSEYKDEMFFKSIIVSEGLSTSHYCSNGICTVSIEVAHLENIPNNIEMYVTDGGSCKKMSFPTEGYSATLGYEATIEFTDELVQMLNITGSDYQVSSQKSTGFSSWKMMGTKKVNLFYDTIVSMDDLKVDGVLKAKIIFSKGSI